MAYIAQIVTTGTDGTAAASVDFVDWLDQQQSGDYLVVVASNDGGGTALSGMTGWTEHYLSSASVGGTRAGVWSQKNTGTPITAPTLSGANDEWAVVALLVRDADGTNFLDVAIGTTEQSSNTRTPACPAVTTTTANALVLRIVATDGAAVVRPQLPFQGAYVALRHDNMASAPTTAVAVDYQVKVSAGSTGTYDWYSNVNDTGVYITLAIKNASGGRVPAAPTSTPITPILSLTDVPSAPTATALVTLHASPATILGYECAATDTTGGAVENSITNYQTTYGPRGWYGYLRVIGQVQTATTGLGSRTYGAAWSVTADLDANIFVAQVIAQPTSSLARLVTSTAYYFRDSAGAYALWRPLTKAQALTPRPLFAHLPSETMAETGGGTIDWSDIVYIGVASPLNATSNANATVGASFWFLGTLPYSSGTATPVSLTGGTADDPISARDVTLAAFNPLLNSFFAIQGAKQQLLGFPVQIGDGTNATVFNGDAGATEYIESAPVTLGYNPPDGALAYKVKAKSTDSISFGSQAVGSSNAHKFVIDSASSTSAAYDFGGTVFGLAPTLIDGITLTGTAFADCGEIDAQTATLVNCTIKGTTSTDAAIAYDGNATMTGCTIDVTGTSAAYHLELGASVTAFTLASVTFTGTPGTDKVHVKATSGTVTLTLSGSTTLAAGDVTSDGATVTIVSGADVTLTGLVSGSEVRAYVGTPDSNTLIDSTESSSTSFTFNQSEAGNAGFITIRKTNYVFEKISLTYSGSDVSIPVSQRLDRVYANP